MSDPYRPSYYPPPTAEQSRYNPTDYAADDYGHEAGALTRRRSSNSGYYPQSTALTQPPYRGSDDGYDRDDTRSHRSHSHRHRSHSRSVSRTRHHHGADDDSYYDDERSRGSKDKRHRSRSRSKSRVKEFGATAAGGAAGAWLGRELGHKNKLATIGGLVAGGIAAHELEKRYEKRQRSRSGRDSEVPYGEGRNDEGGAAGPRDRTRRRSSFVDQVKEKVGGLLDPEGRESAAGRRSRSHVGSSSGGGRDRGGRYDDSDSSGDDAYYEKRRGAGSRRGSRSRRDRDRDDYE